MAGLIGFQAQREAGTGALNAGDLQRLPVVVNQLNRSFLALTSARSNEEGRKGLCFNHGSDPSCDFESNIADGRILKGHLNEAFVVAGRPRLTKTESEHTPLPRKDAG
ncbi:MAG: hypothetical protein DME25_05595 [Verrucomicrobia bacterium]|nr:MAG: hypothetical protein DME25_05595 [Verrucomicrobiota bacterium]